MAGRRRVYFGWYVVFACFWLATFAWGFGFYGHSVYLAELTGRHGWSNTSISTATTIYYLVSAGIGVYVGDAIARSGPRPVVSVGICAMAAAALLIGVVRELWQLYFAYLLMAIGWASMTTVSITSILARWFAARRGLAISLSLTGASFGGILIVPVMILLAQRLGFALALAILVGLMLLLLLPLVLSAFRAGPEAVGQAVDGEGRSAGQAAGGAAPAAGVRRLQLLASWRFWSSAAPIALGSMAQVGFLVHQISYLEPLIGNTEAGFAVALTTAAAVAGRLLLGLVVDRLNPRTMTALSLAGQALAIFVLLQTREPLLLYGMSILFGISVGNLITLPSLIVQREFPAAAFATVIALTTAIVQVMYAFGPGLLGWIRDMSGSYPTALAACVALELAGAAIILRQPRSR